MKRILSALLFASFATQAAAVGRLADLSIYDRTEGRSLPVYWQDGKPWVVGTPGNEYQVNIRNHAGQEVLAVISVDGINVLSGEAAATSQRGYIVDAWRNLDVKGWRKSLKHTAAFYFTSLPDSYAGRTGRPDDVGVIGAALFRRKPVPPPVVYFDPPRADAQSNLRERGAPASAKPAAPAMAAPAESAAAGSMAKREESRLGTGHGRSEYSQVREVAFERATEYPEEVVTIYYDSYANLLARGVIVAVAPPGREPRAFPARFVADPPRR